MRSHFDKFGLESTSVTGEGGEINSADREAFASFGEEKWRAKFLLKRQIDLEEVDTGEEMSLTFILFILISLNTWVF